MKNSLAKQKLEFYVLRQVETSLNKLSKTSMNIFDKHVLIQFQDHFEQV